MLDLQLPVRHDWVVQGKNYGKLVMEPFEPGFALTVGIAYRRALLSAIHGAAPTWVKIEHVLHEFSHLPGVTEDTLDIMMNLRKVAFVLHVNRPKILRLKAQGPGTVTASDFEKDAGPRPSCSRTRTSARNRSTRSRRSSGRWASRSACAWIPRSSSGCALNTNARVRCSASPGRCPECLQARTIACALSA